MLLQIDDGIEVPEYYKRSGTHCEFLGFLPMIDDRHSYYTVENIGTCSVYNRVSPVFGELNTVIMTDSERWYEDPISDGAREESRLQHEYYRDEILQRVKNCPYCVWFIGCDDGDTFMRFESKETAMEFLNSVFSFDEIFEHQDSQYW